jgi:sarcosine oxidase subunit alpha
MPRHDQRGERGKAGGRLPGGPEKEIKLDYEGEPIPAREGEPVAVSLLAAGVEVFSRSAKYHRPRGAYCLTGRCSNCLMRVDGAPNVATCRTPARDGLRVERQNAYPSASHDVFAAIDWMYPKGLDHHSMFAGIPVVGTAASKVARHLSGLGTLPDRVIPEEATVAEHATDVAVVGAGPAGLAAARAAAEAGAKVLVIEEQDVPGGRLSVGLDRPGDLDAAWVDRTREAIVAAGGSVLTGAFAFGLYRDERGPCLAVRAEGRMLLVRPRSLVVANGGAEPPPPFGNNDLPGIFAGRGLARLIHRYRAAPGSRAVILGTGADAVALADLLAREGVEVAGLVGPEAPCGAHRRLGDEVIQAKGHRRIGQVAIRTGGGKVEVDCDLLAIAGDPAPMCDLARQAGAFVRWDHDLGTFRVAVSEDGATSSTGVFACGEVTGPCSAAEAAERGERTGRAAARFAAEARA